MAVCCDDVSCDANRREYVPVRESLSSVTTNSDNEHIYLDGVIDNHNFDRDCAFEKRLRLDQNRSEIIHIGPCWPSNDRLTDRLEKRMRILALERLTMIEIRLSHPSERLIINQRSCDLCGTIDAISITDDC